MAIVVAVIVIAAAVGIAYLVAPDAVRMALHWWQPRWF
jgi:hypothetical protein